MIASEKLSQAEKPKSANKVDKEKIVSSTQAPSKSNSSKVPIKPSPAALAKTPIAKAQPQPTKTKAPPTNNTKAQVGAPINPAPVVAPAPPESKSTEATTNNEVSAPKESLKYVKKKNFNFNKFILYVQIQLVTARVYSRLKEFDKARSFYEKAIQKEPKVI